MSTSTSRGRISRMRPLTMLPSLKSRIDFEIKSCICNMSVKLLLVWRDSEGPIDRGLGSVRPAKIGRHTSHIPNEGQMHLVGGIVLMRMQIRTLLTELQP